MEHIFEKDFEAFKDRLSELPDSRLLLVLSTISENVNDVIEDFMQKGGGLTL